MTLSDIHAQVVHLIQSSPGIAYPDESTLPDLTTLNQGLQTVADLVPGLGLALRQPSLQFSGFSPADKKPLLTLSGALTAGDSQARIALTLHSGSLGKVSVSLDTQEDQPFALADLFQLVGGVNIFQELPSELNLADRFALKSLTIDYDFAARDLSLIQVSLGLGDWNIFYGLTILDARLSIDITDPFKPSRLIHTTIGGGYVISNIAGETIATLDVELFIPSDGSDWELVATGGLGGDQNGFLDAVTGDLRIADWLPDSITDPTIHIREFFLRFSPQRKKIFQTRIHVALDLEWKVVENLIHLSDPYFAFDIVFPDNPEADATRILEGFIKTEKVRLLSSLDDLLTGLGELKKQLEAKDPASLQATDGILRRFTTDIKNKLSEIEKLEKVLSYLDNAQKALLQDALNALKPTASPVQSLETALDECKKSIRGTLFPNALAHLAKAKTAAEDMLIAIGKQSLQSVLNNLKTQFQNKPENKAKINARLGGYMDVAGATLHVLAVRDESKTWRFSGQMEDELALLATARQFLGNGINPPADFRTDLTINVLEAQITLPPKPKPASFRVLCGMKDLWSMQVGDFSLTAESLLFAIDHKGPGQTSGMLSGAAVFNGMKTTLSYAFAPNQAKLAINWEGMIGEYEKTTTASQILRLKIQHKSVGDLISLMVRTVNPGMGTFRLPEPWDFLDKIPADLDLEYHVKGPKAGQLKLTKALDIDLVVVQITGISVIRTTGKKVTIALQGLDHPEWDAADPASPPPDAGGLGKRLIDLRLLALGQHVALQHAGQMTTMKEAITALRRFTVPGSEGIPDAILFSPESNWLVGMDFGLLQVPPFDAPKPVYALQLSALFNDPNIYGLRIELAGDKIPPLKGLKFEILYTRINDSIGKYHIELALPDIMRYIELGAASLVLPIVVVDVYTNGDFFVDFGFPYNLDFSRSFSITIIVLGVPVLGSGGFYFGKLSGPTAPPRVPKTTKGEFNPVMVFGLGLQIGVGKYFQKGPLTARFSLTVVGMIEGIVATFNPKNALPEGGKNLDKTNYVYLQGTLGIVGILEGAVDFKIIKAKVYIRLHVIAQVTFESYRAMPISLSAGVEVAVSIKIGHGIFSITIRFSFKAHISATFTVGHDHLQDAPWYDGVSARNFAFAAAPRLDLAPLPAPTTKEKLVVYATLQPTVAWDADKKAASQLAFSLVMDCPDIAGAATGLTAFEKMADSVYAWVTQGVLAGDGRMSRSDLLDLLEELRGDTLDILPYAQLKAHLAEQFDLEIKFPDQTLTTATLLPVFPFLKMKVEDEAGSTLTEVDFASFGTCSPQYLNFLSNYFEATSTQPDDPGFAERPGFDASGAALSLAEQLFEDYFLTLAREMVGATISWLEDEKKADATLSKALEALRARNTAGHLSSMLARFFMGGQRLPKDEGLMLQSSPATFDQRVSLFQATGQQFALAGTVKAKVTLSATETIAGWSLPATPYSLPDTLLQKLISLQAEAATAPAFATKALLTPSQLQARDYPLSRAIDWASDNRYIWEFSESIQRQLGKKASALRHLGIQVGKPVDGQLSVSPAGAQSWATLVEIGLKKTANPLAYELTGTNEAGIALLEKIILASPTPAWQDFRLLYRPVTSGLTGKKLVADEHFTAFLTQVNLSTETNPEPQARGLMALATGPAEGVLDQKLFIQRLWAASIVRSGGHYLYYQHLQTGQGLPGELFGQDDTATLYLLIDFGATAPQPYMNCGISDKQIDLAADLVFARDAHFTDKINELQPGYALLEATRARPAGGQGNSFADLFQLLSYEIGNVSAAPIGPRKHGDDSVWLFEQIIPAFRFADPAKRLYTFPAADTKHRDFIRPADADNPYAAIGDTLEVRLQTRDVYGNAIPDSAGTASAAQGYSDALIPLHQWPATRIDFVLRETSIQASLRMVESTYESLEDPAEAWRRDLRLYRKIWYQLFRQDADGSPHLRADLRSTFLGDTLAGNPPAAEDAATLYQLRSYAAQACNYLERKLRTLTDSAPAAVTLTRAFEPRQVNGEAIFELLTEVQLRRTRHIHPDFKDEEAVSLARTPVKATQEQAAGNAELSLRIFAEGLESLFPQLKLATGFDKHELDNYEQQKDLFIVRMDRFRWTKNAPVVLALPPLATMLQDRKVDVGAYSRESGFDTAATQELEFSGIDMDDWARNFLEAFDQFLSPELAGAIYLLDKDAFDRLLQSKKTLAAAMAGKLTPILKDESITPAGKAEAVEKLAQRLLIELSQAYEVNAVVHYPLTFSDPVTDKELRLYGTPVVKAGAARAYSLSNAKIHAGADSFLSFLFTTKTARKERMVELDLEFRGSHLEYQIEPNSNFQGYEASSWLSFVIPPPPTDLGNKVQIPIVLRDFPEAPVLLRQEARQSDNFPDAATAAQILDTATSWDYLIHYNQRLSAQDWLQVEVQFNLTEPQSAMARGFSQDLLEALATFSHHWPALRADLLDLLPGITPKTLGELPQETLQQASQSLSAFTALARNIANAWGSWTPPKKKPLKPKSSEASKVFAVNEFAAQGKLVAEFLKPSGAPGVPDPTLLVGPAEIPPGATNGLRHEYPLPYDEANAEALRALQFEKLRLLAYQNAVATVYLSRNEALITGRESADGFVYYTPETKFPQPLIPLLQNDIEIRLAELLPGQHPLTAYLDRFFQELFKDAHLPKGADYITLQLECSYAYKLADDPTQPFIRLPILLVPPYDYRLDGDTLSSQLAREIREWFDAEQPASGNALARLLFDVAVFSTTSTSRQPVLRLRNVTLDWTAGAIF